MAQITLKGNSISTSGDLPAIGSKAPDFRLVNKDLADCSLAAFEGKRKALVIVPSLDTSVCSTMAKKFNDAIGGRADVVALVISADLPFAAARFCSEQKAENIVTLSTMRSQEFAKDYGVLIQDGPLEGVCARAVVVLDKSNQVVYTQLVGEITTEPDYDQALNHLFLV